MTQETQESQLDCKKFQNDGSNLLNGRSLQIFLHDSVRDQARVLLLRLDLDADYHNKHELYAPVDHSESPDHRA